VIAAQIQQTTRGSGGKNKKKDFPKKNVCSHTG
jgi:hypothetical protein